MLQTRTASLRSLFVAGLTAALLAGATACSTESPSGGGGGGTEIKNDGKIEAGEVEAYIDTVKQLSAEGVDLSKEVLNKPDSPLVEVPEFDFGAEGLKILEANGFSVNTFKALHDQVVAALGGLAYDEATAKAGQSTGLNLDGVLDAQFRDVPQADKDVVKKYRDKLLALFQ